MLLGLGCVACLAPELRPLLARIRTATEIGILSATWNAPAVDWDDYDLVSGPSGLCLALCSDPESDQAAIRPVADHLAGLLQSQDMSAFRITGCRDDPLRGWNLGQVNLGLAHGMVGPLAALLAAIRTLGSHETASYGRAAGDAADWLVTQARHDTLGLVTWPPAQCNLHPSVQAASRREAWCYGAPATAWVLWEAGEVLARPDLCDFALETFETYGRTFDPHFHLDDDPDERLALCHGAAGVLMIADAFARTSGSAESARFAARQEALLRQGLPQAEDLGRRNPTLLSGGSGILTALLTRGGADRRWLAALGLR